MSSADPKTGILPAIETCILNNFIEQLWRKPITIERIVSAINQWLIVRVIYWDGTQFDCINTIWLPSVPYGYPQSNPWAHAWPSCVHVLRVSFHWDDSRHLNSLESSVDWIECSFLGKVVLGKRHEDINRELRTEKIPLYAVLKTLLLTLT